MARPSPIWLALGLLAPLAVAGCQRPSPPSAEAPVTAATAPAPVPGIVERPSAGPDQDLADALSFYASRPTEETPLDPGLKPVDGVPGRSAQVCGACHQAIYEEWKVSTHRHAWNDPQFQKELQKSTNDWLCANCHTPTLAQQPVWAVGLQEGDVEAPIVVPNTQHDAALMDEGVTCVACHVRDGVIHGPGLVGSTAPHAVVADGHYRDGTLCERCHQAERTYPGKGFVCTFTTGTEWRASPQFAEGQTCASCHMPEVERPVAVGGPVRRVRRHWFKGSGLPKFRDAAPPDDALPGPGLGLAATATEAGLVLDLHNAHAGHHLPAGDPERWVQIDVRFVDGAGEPVGEPWQHRIGQVWTWWPEPKRESDNRLAADERRTLTVPWPEAATEARIEASVHRLSDANAAYHGLTDYPRSRVTHEVVVGR